jgi:ABC-type uncharacterized transport system substrate-binding protein
MSDAVLFTYRRQIGSMAIKNRLPAISTVSEYAEAGLLLTYGASLPDLWYRSATYVDKILKGSKPADLPIEQPTKFELVIEGGHTWISPAPPPAGAGAPSRA